MRNNWSQYPLSNTRDARCSGRPMLCIDIRTSIHMKCFQPQLIQGYPTMRDAQSYSGSSFFFKTRKHLWPSQCTTAWMLYSERCLESRREARSTIKSFQSLLYLQGKPDQAGGPMFVWYVLYMEAGRCRRPWCINQRNLDMARQPHYEVQLKKSYGVTLSYRMGSLSKQEARCEQQCFVNGSRSEPEAILCMNGRPVSAGGPSQKSMSHWRLTHDRSWCNFSSGLVVLRASWET